MFIPALANCYSNYSLLCEETATGGSCAAMEGMADQLQRELGCPVVDPVAAGFKIVETLADLRVRLNLSISKVYDYEARREGTALWPRHGY